MNNQSHPLKSVKQTEAKNKFYTASLMIAFYRKYALCSLFLTASAINVSAIWHQMEIWRLEQMSAENIL